ncbi:hypothetical protein PH4a_00585 [Proteus hauseri]|nr:hypothetical protein PH4a_00585 [Proteus hauseri]
MTKFILIGLMAICITALCLSLLGHERLCSFNIRCSHTVIQATLPCDK